MYKIVHFYITFFVHSYIIINTSKVLLFKEELFNNFTDDEIIKIEEIYKDSNSSFDYYNMKLHEIEFDKIRRKLYGEEALNEKSTIFNKILRKLKKN